MIPLMQKNKNEGEIKVKENVRSKENQKCGQHNLTSMKKAVEKVELVVMVKNKRVPQE